MSPADLRSVARHQFTDALIGIPITFRDGASRVRRYGNAQRTFERALTRDHVRGVPLVLLSWRVICAMHRLLIGLESTSRLLVARDVLWEFARSF